MQALPAILATPAVLAWLAVLAVAAWALTFRVGDADAELLARLELRTTDGSGRPIPARVHVRDSTDSPVPSDPDSALMVHRDWPWMGSYFYVDSTAALQVRPGWTTIYASRGPEWRPLKVRLYVEGDTTVVLPIVPAFDMRSRGWYGGDVHTHAIHDPVEYDIRPSHARRVALAEDLPMTWILDCGSEFTGSPHAVSDSAAMLYYSCEYRNQAWGHAALLGLRDSIAYGCCLPPSDVHPMLGHTRAEWDPEWDQAMVLAHPLTGAHLFDDSGWDAWSLGREAPVLAALGDLDAYDIASYGTAGIVNLTDWYGFLNCGLHVPPSAGTDAMLCRFWSKPPGGFRVYVREDGFGHDAPPWTAGLRAGRSFVTNLPLLPVFEVDGNEAGTVVDRSGPTTSVSVRFRVECVARLQTARLIRNGEIEREVLLPGSPFGTVYETEFPVDLTESSWLALRVDGTTDLRCVASPALFAHTGPVYVRLDGAEVARTVDAARFIDRIDSLAVFADRRGNWESHEDRAQVFARLDEARERYAALFHEPPASFSLLAPEPEETLAIGEECLFDWSDALDPEPGDRVVYNLTVSPDTSGFGGFSTNRIAASELRIPVPAIWGQGPRWWTVAAVDRGGNRATSSPRYRRFVIHGTAASVEASVDGEAWIRARVRVHPNPARHDTWIALGPAPAVHWSLEVIDAAGRVRRRWAHGTTAIVPAEDGGVGLWWDLRDDDGRRVPSGVYWLRLGGAGPVERARGHARVLVVR